MTTTCRTCVTPIGYINCPTGGWWAHEKHPADNHDAVPAAWVDNDPLMETIAETVWAHCRTEGTSLVVDDPRNIAATAAAVARHFAAAVSVPPPADQTALRERIAEALMRWAEGNNDQRYASMRRPETVRANAYSRADAVLAVLPEQTDRAALLREAADTVFALEFHKCGRANTDFVSFEHAWDLGTIDAADELRRVAAEEQPAETQARWTAAIRIAALEEAAQLAVAENATCPAVGPCQPCQTRERVAAELLRAAERPAVGEQPETQEARPCGSAHPGGGFALGVRCALEEHSGDHGRDEEIPGTGHTVQLRWPNQERP